jgi:hypothetical protein
MDQQGKERKIHWRNLGYIKSSVKIVGRSIMAKQREE